MPPDLVVPLFLRVGEVLTLALGFGLSTLAICARLYTKVRIDRKMMIEDCKCSPPEEISNLFS
jgi:hypothetical protein